MSCEQAGELFAAPFTWESLGPCMASPHPGCPPLSSEQQHVAGGAEAGAGSRLPEEPLMWGPVRWAKQLGKQLRSSCCEEETARGSRQLGDGHVVAGLFDFGPQKVGRRQNLEKVCEWEVAVKSLLVIGLI